MMSPASKLSSSGSMVTWSHSASAKASGTSICHVTGREKEGLRLQETTYALLILNCRKVKLISTAVWGRAFCFPILDLTAAICVSPDASIFPFALLKRDSDKVRFSCQTRTSFYPLRQKVRVCASKKQVYFSDAPSPLQNLLISRSPHWKKTANEKIIISQRYPNTDIISDSCLWRTLLKALINYWTWCWNYINYIDEDSTIRQKCADFHFSLFNS